jgi:hypothetical protein
MSAEELGDQWAFPIEFLAANGFTKLEALTAAALTGLCANPEIDVSSDKIGVVAVTAAKLTLKALVEEPQ